MKKNTMYILGGVALVGVAYYLYNKNKPTTQTNSSGFANAIGTKTTTTTDTTKTASPCGGCGSQLRWVSAVVVDEYGNQNQIYGCVPCSPDVINPVRYIPNK